MFQEQLPPLKCQRYLSRELLLQAKQKGDLREACEQQKSDSRDVDPAGALRGPPGDANARQEGFNRGEHPHDVVVTSHLHHLAQAADATEGSRPLSRVRTHEH